MSTKKNKKPKLKSNKKVFTIFFTILFIVIPGLLIYLMLSKDIQQVEQTLLIKLMFTLGYIILVPILTYIFWTLKLLAVRVFKYANTIPLIISIFLYTENLQLWIRIIIIIIVAFIITPLNLLIMDRIEYWRKKKTINTYKNTGVNDDKRIK